MKITREQMNYLCLSKLKGGDQKRLVRNLNGIDHFVVNDTLSVLVSEESVNSILTTLVKDLEEKDRINIIALSGSGLFGVNLGGLFQTDRRTVFDK